MKKVSVKKEILKFLKAHKLTAPSVVDRLLITAFLIKNGLTIKRNQLLSDYVINPDERECLYVLQLLAVIEQLGIEFSFEELVNFFEFVISPEDRIVTGAVYTPKKIREYIVNQTLRATPVNQIKIADISCGCGAFLLTAADIINAKYGIQFETIFRDYLYGLDIQEYSVTRTKLLLSLLAVSKGEDIEHFHFNLFVGDALEFKWSNVIRQFEGFDILVGNPPYVCSRNISNSTKKLLVDWVVCSTGHPDLYIPFIQIAIESLKDGGTLGLITMNTFFKSVNGRALRSYLQERSYNLKILDFGTTQIFDSKSTYTCICFIRKNKSDHLKYKLDELVDLPVNSFNIVKYLSLTSAKGWNLQNVDLINKIESTGESFGELYMTRNGVATLKNHIYIFDPVAEDDEYYYLQNGSLFEIEKSICRDIVNTNKLTTVNNIEGLKQKILFPYIFNGTKPDLIAEKELKLIYPKAYKYLTVKRDVLATRDKGQGEYEKWYAFGRNQSIEKLKHKLFFPHITSSIPHFVVNSDENLLFYNGIAAIGDSRDELKFLSKLMKSNLFWFYIKNSSKPYASGYYSLSRNYIKNFGVFPFSKEEKKYIVYEDDMILVNRFLELRYGINV